MPTTPYQNQGHSAAQNLSALPNLRRALFADNQISHIESLEGCTALEELCLEENRVGAIEGLQACTRCARAVDAAAVLGVAHCAQSLGAARWVPALLLLLLLRLMLLPLLLCVSGCCLPLLKECKLPCLRAWEKNSSVHSWNADS